MAGPSKPCKGHTLNLLLRSPSIQSSACGIRVWCLRPRPAHLQLLLLHSRPTSRPAWLRQHHPQPHMQAHQGGPDAHTATWQVEPLRDVRDFGSKASTHNNNARPAPRLAMHTQQAPSPRRHHVQLPLVLLPVLRVSPHLPHPCVVITHHPHQGYCFHHPSPTWCQ